MAESTKFKAVKMWYDTGMWNIEKVRNAVVKKWITQPEFKKITGLEFS